MADRTEGRPLCHSAQYLTACQNIKERERDDDEYDDDDDAGAGHVFRVDAKTSLDLHSFPIKTSGNFGEFRACFGGNIVS